MAETTIFFFPNFNTKDACGVPRGSSCSAAVSHIVVDVNVISFINVLHSHAWVMFVTTHSVQPVLRTVVMQINLITALIDKQNRIVKPVPPDVLMSLLMIGRSVNFQTAMIDLSFCPFRPDKNVSSTISINVTKMDEMDDVIGDRRCNDVMCAE